MSLSSLNNRIRRVIETREAREVKSCRVCHKTISLNSKALLLKINDIKQRSSHSMSEAAAADFILPPPSTETRIKHRVSSSLSFRLLNFSPSFSIVYSFAIAHKKSMYERLEAAPLLCGCQKLFMINLREISQTTYRQANVSLLLAAI